MEDNTTCVEPGHVNYTDNYQPVNDSAWNSQPFYRYSAFGQFHQAANACIQWIFPDYEKYTGYRINADDLLDFSEDNINVDDMIWGNRGPLAFAIIGLIFAAVITIFGIGWCCMKICSCCGRKKSKGWDRYNSGRYSDDELLGRSREKRRRKCARICCGTTLILSIALSVYPLVGLFVMNEHLRKGIDGATGDIDNALDDVQLYLNSTSKHIDAVFTASYEDLACQLRCILDDANDTDSVVDSRASSIHSFQKFENQSRLQIQQQDEIIVKLAAIDNKLQEFCQVGTCTARENISKNIANAVSSLGDIRAELEIMRTYSANTWTLLSAKDFTISNDLYPTQLNETIDRQGEYIASTAKLLTDAISEVYSNIQDARSNLRDVELEFDQVNPHLHTSMLVLCLFLTLVSFMFLVGGLLSLCGGDNKCVKKSRSATLNCGIFTMFLFGGILWIFTMACFLLSGALTQVLPGALRSIENNETGISNSNSRFTIALDVENYVLPSYRFIAQNCKDGQSAYVTFNLSQVYDISNITRLVEWYNETPEGFTSFGGMKEGLEDISDTVPVHLNRLALLQNRSSNLRHAFDEIQDALRNIVENNQNVDIGPLQTSRQDLEGIRQTIINQADGYESLRNLLRSVSPKVSQWTQLAYDHKKFIAHVGNYSTFVENETMYNIGQCEPMYNALNSTINLFSYKIGSPVAGFWFGLNIVMLLFFPSIITAIVLQRL